MRETIVVFKKEIDIEPRVKRQRNIIRQSKIKDNKSRAADPGGVDLNLKNNADPDQTKTPGPDQTETTGSNPI